MKRWQLCKHDGCTCWPDSWHGRGWTTCCRAHDIGYGRQQRTRAAVDHDFLICLLSRTWTPNALAMYLAVRTFGWIFWAKARRRKM